MAYLTQSAQPIVTPSMNQTGRPGWLAELQLRFKREQTKTLLSHRKHQGPLVVQRPFYPEGGMCHVYLLHPPGGVVAGDRITMNVEVGQRAEALITTPAAGKFYRSEGNTAEQNISLSIQNDALLEWVPQETIIFEGANLCSSMQIQLADTANFLGWEMIALGRPAADEGFSQGNVELNWRICRHDELLYHEKMRIDPKAYKASWGLNGKSVFGTLFATSASKEDLQQVREIIAETPDIGVTLMDDLLICRASTENTETIRRYFESIRLALRHSVVGRNGYSPRIWLT